MLSNLVAWISQGSHRLWISAALFAFAILIGLIAFLRTPAAGQLATGRATNDPRDQAFSRWWAGSDEDRQALITHRNGVCPNATFLLPAEGYIGLLYGDPRGPYSADHRHQGVDIFSPSEPGLTPVIAAFDGYLTREAGWKSAVIIRIPDDPVKPGRQIWTYYTHMADASGNISYIDPAFPLDTHEVFIKQGTRLGYTGNYSGNPFNPVGVHLHFSVVRDNGFGGYTNELDFNNTIDPSRYLGIAVNYGCAPVVPTCDPNPLCGDAILPPAGN